MGKGQSKIIHSISLNFAKRGGETKKDPAEISLMRVRSSSLESVSTIPMKPHPLSQVHSSSADDVTSNLINQGTPSDSNASTIDGDTSADSLSLSCEGDSPKERGFTQSLPVAIERKISMGSKDTPAGDSGRRDLDCFSDNFITTPENNQTEVNCVEEDAWSPTVTAAADSALKSSPVQLESSFQLPTIPDSLLQKLSPEEWSMFINFVCATLGNSLHSSIVDEKLRPSLIKENISTNQIDPVDCTSDHTPKEVKVCGGHRERSTRYSRHSQRRRRRNRLDFEDADDTCGRSHLQSGDRPLSLPSLHRLTSDDNELIQRLQVLSLKRQEVGPEVEEEMEVEPEDRRLRSKSQDDYSYCPHGEQFQPSRNRECRHRCPHHRSGKRRRARGHVDTSLDDNCPGLPQNRVTRRSRHHHAYQQHSVCEQCLQERLGNNSPPMSAHKKRSTKQHRHIHSATGEVVMADGVDLSPGSKSAGEGEREVESSYMTLQDIKAVASDFLKGTNDLDESVIEDLKMQFLLGMEEQRKQHTAAATANAKGGQRNMRQYAIQPGLSRNRPRNMSSARVATSSNKIAPLWSQLAFPTEPHTGQDSPRTDMAVINLDINSSVMRQPLNASSLRVSANQPHHVHVHHVIHHSQP